MSEGSMTGDLPTAPSPAARESNEPPGHLQHRIIAAPQRDWERLWLWASERVNPIVVKEVRQSLKSRQFTISFGLTLIAAVSWTLIAISMMVPRIFYMPAGVPLLTGYFCILAVPLMIIIPLVAFLSLTAETEDSTFELLSISALSAQQIVYGKMASACVQILLYLSALAPSIVLTYLLRGVGLSSILLLLAWTVVLSIAETALGMLLGAIARTRMLQVIAAVVLLGGLFWAMYMWLYFVMDFGLPSMPIPGRQEYLISAGLASVLAAICTIALRAAAAAIDFPSENHSTPLRRRILALLCLVCFWTLLLIIASQELQVAQFMLIAVFVPAMVIGTLITGERGVISPRAQRSLPQSFLGRVFLTWFYPGAGLGYVFIVCIYAAFVATIAALEMSYEGKFNFRGGMSQSVWELGYVLLGYLAIYVGINRLLMMLVPRKQPSRMVAAVAMMVALLLLSHLGPLFAVYYASDYRPFDYAWHQSFNIFWTIDEAFNANSSDLQLSMVIITLCAIAVFGLNLLLCTRDVMLVRVGLPPRVRDDELANRPATALPADPFVDA